MANEISAAAIECGAKAEKRKSPAVAVCWPRHDHLSAFGACKKLAGWLVRVLNRVNHLSVEFKGNNNFRNSRDLRSCIFLALFGSKEENQSH
jgi:hypothetical protein